MRQIIGIVGFKGSGKDTCADILVAKAGFERTSFARELYVQAANAFGVTVAFLNERSTKETPLRRLALKLCLDRDYLEVVVGQLARDPEVRAAFWHFYDHGVYPPTLSPHKHRLVRELLGKGRRPRFVLQRWGHEYRRKSRFGHDSYWRDIEEARMRRAATTNFVIPDVRYGDEADLIEGLGGWNLLIERPDVRELDALAGGAATAAHASEQDLAGREFAARVINRTGQLGDLECQLLNLVGGRMKLAA